MTACAATDPCNPHLGFMPLVEALADAHGALGGGMIALAVLQFGLWIVLYAILSLPTLAKAGSFARVTAQFLIALIASYLLTGLLTLGLSFYALTPAMNWVGVAYLSLIWPLWIYAGVGVPQWLAPLMFTFS